MYDGDVPTAGGGYTSIGDHIIATRVGVGTKVELMSCSTLTQRQEKKNILELAY